MYSRGGKVWIGNNGFGLVFLEKDWQGNRLPNDLTEEAGVLGSEFELLTPFERAKLGGYFIEKSEVCFVAETGCFSFENNPALSIFLACEENNWLNQTSNEEEWLLQNEGNGFHCGRFHIEKFRSKSEFRFKFKTSEGKWLDPPDFIPCKEESIPGGCNFIFSKEREGRDILKFQIVDGTNPMPVERWLASVPENLGYSERTFRLFAPRAKEVFLKISTNDLSNQFLSFAMQKTESGVWEYFYNEEIHKAKYFYEVTHPHHDCPSRDFSKKVLDPYAKSCIGREGPGLITQGNTQISKVPFSPPSPSDLVIVEVHIRDLLKKAPIEISSEKRLEFRGLAEWLKSDQCYLRKLGANAVELQPIQQFDSRKKEEYHWGYMPVNFFSPSSDYASSPEKAETEFRMLVDAFHEAGIAVILDVVYNHVGIPNHLLNIDREIYLATDDLGRLTNHSGCGNDLRCDSAPTRKLILDSLKHWITTYNVDGFRFDLGELLGFELLCEIQCELMKIMPKVVLIAEPWSFRGRLPREMNQTSFSLWSDRCRESLLKFSMGNGNKDEVIRLLQGKLDHENQFPWQSINYLESHDDFSFIDRLCSSNENSGISPSKDQIEQARLAIFILLISPGIPMISAGQDFLRSKQGIRNTYQHEEVNALDYDRLDTFQEFAKEVRSVIHFRLSDRGRFSRPTNPDDCEYEVIDLAQTNILTMIIKCNSSHEEFLFCCNPDNHEKELNLPPDWSRSDILFPLSSISKQPHSLKSWGYCLLARDIE